MILITHDFGVVAETCDKVAVVYGGEIIEYGTKEELFDHPVHPYTHGLFGAIPSMSGDVERLKPIEGLPPDPTAVNEGCKFLPRCPYASEACRRKVENVTISADHQCRCVLAKAQE